MKETDITQDFATYVDHNLPQAMVAKIDQQGWPDRLIFLPSGRAIFIEFKKPGTGRLSDYQRYIIRRLTANGGEVHVVDNDKEACHIVEHALREARK